MQKVMSKQYTCKYNIFGYVQIQRYDNSTLLNSDLLQETNMTCSHRALEEAKGRVVIMHFQSSVYLHTNDKEMIARVQLFIIIILTNIINQ